MTNPTSQVEIKTCDCDWSVPVDSGTIHTRLEAKVGNRGGGSSNGSSRAGERGGGGGGGEEVTRRLKRHSTCMY